MFRRADREPVNPPQDFSGTVGGPLPVSTSAPLSLQAVELTQTFGGRRTEPVVALDRFSIDIEPGEFVAVVGPSGCGKTTLLRTFAGLEQPTAGEAFVGGELIRRPRRDVSMMFQAPTLLPWKSVLGNCLLPTSLDHRVGDADRDRALALLEWAGLGGFAHRNPHELSGGMQQRVAICRALLGNPSVLLLDEPFGALDAMTREQMNTDLQAIWAASGITAVLITHDIAEAVYLAQRVLVLSPRPGRLVDVVDVPLPRERDESVLASPEFAAACARVRSHFVRRVDHARV